MKLAEGLIVRADLQTKIRQVKNRMGQNAKVQEGDEPGEDVKELVSMYETMMTELESIILRINRTNSNTPLDGGTLADAIVRRDCMKSKISAYRELCDNSSITQDRYSRSEVKFVRFVNVAETQKKIDDLSKMYRELDTKMQGLNWTTDLLD